MHKALVALEQDSSTAQDAVVGISLNDCLDTSERLEKSNLTDAALLIHLQHLASYQVASYASTLAIAKQLGEADITAFLKESAASNELAAKHCAQIALQVNAEAFIDTHSEKCVPTV